MDTRRAHIFVIDHNADPSVAATHAMKTSMVARPHMGHLTFYEHVFLCHPSALKADDGTVT